MSPDQKRAFLPKLREASEALRRAADECEAKCAAIRDRYATQDAETRDFAIWEQEMTR